jgi:hypothetical protein
LRSPSTTPCRHPGAANTRLAEMRAFEDLQLHIAGRAIASVSYEQPVERIVPIQAL